MSVHRPLPLSFFFFSSLSLSLSVSLLILSKCHMLENSLLAASSRLREAPHQSSIISWGIDNARRITVLTTLQTCHCPPGPFSYLHYCKLFPSLLPKWHLQMRLAKVSQRVGDWKSTGLEIISWLHIIKLNNWKCQSHGAIFTHTEVEDVNSSSLIFTQVVLAIC